MTTIIAAGLILSVAVALLGLGLVARTIFRFTSSAWPITISIGLAFFIFIGGVLNLVHLAFPVVLYSLLAIGLVSAILKYKNIHDLQETYQSSTRDERIYYLIWIALTLAIAIFTIVTQLSPTFYNQHDDLQKYFAHVAKIVQTGTLFGSPLNTLGSETLGAQALLQSLAAGPFGFSYINAVDAIFCLLLLMVLIGNAAIGQSSMGTIAILVIIFAWLFEPQYVSITTLYAGAALVFTLVALSIDENECQNDALSPSPIKVGLIYAALIALKSTFLFFVPIHFITTFSLAIINNKLQLNIKNGIKIIAWTSFFISPWFIFHVPHYFSALINPATQLHNAPVPATESLNLFSPTQLVYGGSYLKFTIIVIAILVLGGIVIARQRSNPIAMRFFGNTLATPITYFVMVVVLGPLLAGYGTALRHFLPVLIGVSTASFVYYCRIIGSTHLQSPSRLATSAISIMMVLLILLVLPDALIRGKLLIQNGSMLGYQRSWSPVTIERMQNLARDALQGDLGKRINAIQALVPAHEPLLVWIATPFLLDFNRNPILDVDIGGISTPWATTPAVSYIMWQYDGTGVRKPKDYVAQMSGPGRRETYLAYKGYYYANQINKIAKDSDVIFNDKKIILMKIKPETKLP